MKFKEKDASNEIATAVYDLCVNRFKMSKESATQLSEMSRKLWKPGNIQISVSKEPIKIKHASEAEFINLFKAARDSDIADEDIEPYNPYALDLDKFLDLGHISDDLWIDFDFENWDYIKEDSNSKDILGYYDIDGITFWGMRAGGDWQYPIYFVLYVDSNGELGAYIPEKTNAYDKETNEAYCNSLDFDKIPDKSLDFEAMKSEILNNLRV